MSLTKKIIAVYFALATVIIFVLGFIGFVLIPEQKQFSYMSVTVIITCIILGIAFFIKKIVLEKIDITQLKEMEKRKLEFANLVSHQLRTPLTAIKWITELFIRQKSDNLSEEQKGFLQNIQQSNERLIKMVNDLLETSELEIDTHPALDLKPVNIVDIMGEVIRDQMPIARSKNINIVFQNRLKKNATLILDYNKIKKVIATLLDNAIQYSPEAKGITIGCQEEESNVVFYIQDEGVGIPPQEQKRIFEKFFRGSNIVTLSTDGNGLSLFIAKKIIEAHAGEIWFESKENHGTTFYLSLPMDKMMA